MTKIEIRQYKVCNRIFTDGKYRFTVSYLQESSDAIDLARAWYAGLYGSLHRR